MKKAIQATGTEVRLADYKPPVYLVDRTELDFDIRGKLAHVRSRLSLRRNPDSKDKNGALVLDGENQKLINVTINGVTLSKQNYVLTEHSLTIEGVPDQALVEIESTNEPAKNLALQGLYQAGDMLCTQCETLGFRRITYYPDRPDVSSKFYVTIHADAKKYPILLANGNLLKKGKEKDGRHYAVWEDPHRKPCYLFALVAGKMDRAASSFTTKSGRKVLLEVYTEPGRKSETGFALQAIKKAMKWDEETFGLEYDLDRFMIVAVSAFNYGAMENKGLNIFNDACVLGRSDTATDADIAFFERVVGHEYFHNYTGDRVTCRNWFQLSLKEGLTVFREQQFCGAMNSPTLERIRTVSKLRSFQFPEDAGAMAHPVRPASYQEIDNFYTSTVYDKGAEVVRMIHTFVGEKGFRKGLRLYLNRFDGGCATCDDFVAAMAEANGIDLTHFMLWYSQAGTPVLDITSAYNKRKKEYTLTVKQKTPPTPGQPRKKPLYMPLSVGLLDEKGRDMKGTFVIDLSIPEDQITFLNVESEPVPSLLRNFSAPVRLNYAYTEDELLLLMAHDPDSFNRWDAGQKLFAHYVLDQAPVPEKLIDGLRTILESKTLDAGTKAFMLALPSETDLGLQWLARGNKIDPIKIHKWRARVQDIIAEGLQNELWMTFVAIDKKLNEKDSDGVARGKRSLKNLCLFYLNKVVPEDVTPIAMQGVAQAHNMTDKQASLGLLVDTDGPEKKKALDLFAKTYGKKPTLMDDWLMIQASERKEAVLKTVKKLMRHPAFTLNNPNRVSALLGVFAGNPYGFHAADGSGYDFIADCVLKLGTINGHSAARLAKQFLRWRDFEPKRQKKMKAALLKISKGKKLPTHIKEIVTKALKAA